MIASVRLVGRNALRRHWRAIGAIALLAGAAGAIVCTAAASARRTASSFERFDRFSQAADAEITAGNPTPAQLREFAALPDVQAVGRVRQLTLTLPNGEFIAAGGRLDDVFGTEVDRARIVEGRAANPAAADEVAIGESLAKQLELGIGDTLLLRSFSPAQIEAAMRGQTPTKPEGPDVRLRVVGVERRPLDLALRGEAGGVIVLTPGFVSRYRNEIGSFGGTLLRVRLKPGVTSSEPVVAEAKRIFGNSDAFEVQPIAIDRLGARQAIDVQRAALWIFAGITAIAGAVFVSILTSRVVALEQRDQHTLAGLGMTPRNRMLAALFPGIPMAGAAAVISVIGAVLLSPLLPFGVARRADPDPGIHADWAVLALGSLAVAVVILVVAAITAARVAHTSRAARRGAARHNRASEVAASAGMRPAAVAGVGFALDAGRGGRGVPVRSALAGAVVGAIGVTAAVVFVSSFNTLLATPRAYGWTFDAVMQNPDESPSPPGVPCGEVRGPVLQDRAFTDVAAMCDEDAQVDGRPVLIRSFRSLRGSIEPAVVSGRAPRSPNEIALGAATLSALHRQIGDRVTVGRNDRSKSFEIVGEVVLPTPPVSDPEPIADGAAVTGEGMTAIADPGVDAPVYHYLLRLAPGAQLRADDGSGSAVTAFESGNVQGPAIPVEIERIHNVNHVPAILATVVALLALIAIAHALFMTVRYRRHELAVLRALGFARRQVRATIAWEATTMTVVGLLIGIPLGILVGRVVWNAVAHGLGIAATPDLGALTLLLVVVGALVCVNLLALGASAFATRIKPGPALAVE